MIGRSVFIKVGIFAVITVLAITHVLVRYVGLGASLFGDGYTAYVDLKESGGIFTTASVTYRGVEAGRVGEIALRPDGIRVTLKLNGKHRIPSDVRALVGNGSAIGEQYLELQPKGSDGPYLSDGDVIPQSRTALPISISSLLVSADKLVNSVPRDDLRTVITEAGTAFGDTGPALQRLLDSTSLLTKEATAALPQTIRLLEDGRTVLATQNAYGDEIISFSNSLASFSRQLRDSDADLRRLLAAGPPAAAELLDLEQSIEATLPITLANLVSVGQTMAVRLPAVRQILVIYPYVVATSLGVFPGDGTTRFGVPIPPDGQSPVCTEGYYPKEKRRPPEELKYPEFRWNAFCRAPTDSGIGVRGSRMAPKPDGTRYGDDPRYVRDNLGLPKTNGDTNEVEPASNGSSGTIYEFGVPGGLAGLRPGESLAALMLGPLGLEQQSR